MMASSGLRLYWVLFLAHVFEYSSCDEQTVKRKEKDNHSVVSAFYLLGSEKWKSAIRPAFTKLVVSEANNLCSRQWCGFDKKNSSFAHNHLEFHTDYPKEETRSTLSVKYSLRYPQQTTDVLDPSSRYYLQKHYLIKITEDVRQRLFDETTYSIIDIDAKTFTPYPNWSMNYIMMAVGGGVVLMLVILTFILNLVCSVPPEPVNRPRINHLITSANSIVVENKNETSVPEISSGSVKGTTLYSQSIHNDRSWAEMKITPYQISVEK